MLWTVDSEQATLDSECWMCLAVTSRWFVGLINFAGENCVMFGLYRGTFFHALHKQSEERAGPGIVETDKVRPRNTRTHAQIRENAHGHKLTRLPQSVT